MDSDTAVLHRDPPSDMGRISAQPGGYRVVRQLGRGGAGTVYLAISPSGQRVALKVLAVGGGAEERRRLKREGRLAARLDHPNIVRVHGCGVQAGRPYLVLDLVNGCSLQECLGEGGLDTQRVLSVAEKLARALHHAHEEGILHRDVKPSNVLLDRDGEPRLTDFGLAKTFRADDRDSLLTLEGDVLGTPSFMAPEQALGELHRVGRPADIYGLGATIYAMLTGSPPFCGATWLRVLTDVVHRPPRPPSALVPSVEPGLEAICLRCLAKDPAERYPTALALAEDLSACARRLRGDTPFVAELTVQARPLRLRSSGSLPSMSEEPTAARRTTRKLRPHGESERLLALHCSESEPPLLLAGEELRLRSDSNLGKVDEGSGRRRRRASSRRRTRARRREGPSGAAPWPLVSFLVLAVLVAAAVAFYAVA